MPRLFHFSDDNSIDLFVPRPVTVPSRRAPGMEWLNGPLVWAIDEWHQPMYLFPRDCPRILLWPTDSTGEEDIADYFGGSDARMLAYIEEAWLPRLEAEVLHRYEFPESSFQSLGDAGMWVSRDSVRPVQQTVVRDLPRALESNDVELRAVDSLGSLSDVWKTSLHASGIRLRHAAGREPMLGGTT